MSNTLTVSKGFDRRLSPAEVSVPSLTPYILLAINILREDLALLAKRYSACFLSLWKLKWKSALGQEAIQHETNHCGRQ
jgi:hypothetical protein